MEIQDGHLLMDNQRYSYEEVKSLMTFALNERKRYKEKSKKYRIAKKALPVPEEPMQIQLEHEPVMENEPVHNELVQAVMENEPVYEQTMAIVLSDFVPVHTEIVEIVMEHEPVHSEIVEPAMEHEPVQTDIVEPAMEHEPVQQEPDQIVMENEPVPASPSKFPAHIRTDYLEEYERAHGVLTPCHEGSINFRTQDGQILYGIPQL